MGILRTSDFGLQTFSAFSSARGLPVKTAALGKAISYPNPFCYRVSHASLLWLCLIASCNSVHRLRQGKIPAFRPHPPRSWRRKMGGEDSAQAVARRKDRATLHDLGAGGISKHEQPRVPPTSRPDAEISRRVICHDGAL